MNVLYHFRTRGTGAEAVHIAGVVRAFERADHPVFLSSPTGVDPRETAGSTPFAQPSGGLFARMARHLPHGLFEFVELLYNVPAFFRNLRIARRHDCHLVYERHAFFLFSTALVASILRVPLVVEVNELAGDARLRAQPIFPALARWTDRFLFRRARLIVAVSPHLKRRIEEYGIPEDLILILPNAVSQEELAIPATPLAFGFEPSAFLLGFVGWLVEWHRLDFLIDALASPEFASVVLVLIGEGPLQPVLEAQARARGVRVHFAGALPHAGIPAALRAMDACVVPHSNAYRSPIKLFEFMAQARPVLAPRTEPIESVVRDGQDALLFTPLDPTDFRNSLRKLIDSSQLRDSIGQNGRRLVETNHTWDHNVRKITQNLA